MEGETGDRDIDGGSAAARGSGGEGATNRLQDEREDIAGDEDPIIGLRRKTGMFGPEVKDSWRRSISTNQRNGLLGNLDVHLVQSNVYPCRVKGRAERYADCQMREKRISRATLPKFGLIALLSFHPINDSPRTPSARHEPHSQEEKKRQNKRKSKAY